MSLTSEKISDILLAKRLLKKTQLANAQKIADESKVDLYDIVIDQFDVDKKKLNQVIAKYFKLKYIDLNKYTFDSELQKELPQQKGDVNAVAFLKNKKGLHIATDNPDDQKLFSQIQKHINTPVLFYFTDTKSIQGFSNTNQKINTSAFSDLIDPIISEGETAERPEDLPIVKIVARLLELGLKNKASDIHVEPYETQTLIRFRIDGILHDIANIPKNLHELIVMRIKILSRLRTDEHRAAQDGKLQFVSNNQKIDVRVSTVPIVRGEKIVMRILSENAQQNDIESLGLRPEDLEIVTSNMSKPWGMILSTGPTGSGKTTLLYTIIKKLNKREINISTIEDPVEYDMEGINQIQVNRKTHLTFSRGLRAIVRQDPDIIMVGEIRDTETAKIAINSAMTGHLVLSTLHTNDATTTLPRLLDMGIEPFLVSSTINLVIAQRLVRRLCLDCRVEKKINKEISQFIKKEFSADVIKKYGLSSARTSLFFPKGCKKCQNTGYIGRIGIFELFQISKETKELIMQKVDAETLKKRAVELGMLTMVEDGLLKAKDGITTIEEILRVTKV